MKRLTVVLLTIVLLLTSCKSNEKKNVNVLGGTGELHNVKNNFCKGELYDDENIYFLVTINSALPIPRYSYVKLTKSGKVYANCNLPTCTHIDCEECEARAFYQYFKFGEKLYKYEDLERQIYEGEKDSKKAVYVQCRPEELKDDDAPLGIGHVMVLDEKYLAVDANHFIDILDNSMNVVYTIADKGKYQFIKYYKEHIYYANNLDQLVDIDTATWEAKVIETERFITNPADDAYQTSEYIFYVTMTYDLYRYSLETGEDVLLNDDFSSYYLGIYNGYLYSDQGEFKGAKKIIYDFDGKLVKDVSEYNQLVLNRMALVNGRLYSNRSHGFGQYGFCIASMNPDGSDYREYWMED